MDWLEQAAIVLVLTFCAVLGTIIKYLTGKVSRLEDRLNDETFRRLKQEARDEVFGKSNSDLINEANKRFGRDDR